VTEDVGGIAMPKRTCAGCREVAEQETLVRLAQASDGGVVVDCLRKMPGRGAWVHPRPGCVRAAVRGGGLGRAFRSSVKAEPDALVQKLGEEIARVWEEAARRWERGGRVAGPLARRVAALEAHVAEFNRGSAR